MKWKINRDHIIRLIKTETKNWKYSRPLRDQLVKMLKLQQRVNNPKQEDREFIISEPHYHDILTLWNVEYDSLRKEFNVMSFSDYTTKILELEYRLEHVTSKWEGIARDLLYHFEKTEIWYLKDKRSLKYVVDQLPPWDEIENNKRLMLYLFK